MTDDQPHTHWQLSVGNDAEEQSPKRNDIAGAATKTVAAPVASAANSWGKKTVLLVDLNPRTRDSRARVMRELGATVHCASSTLAARAQLELGAYSLVLLDFGRDVAGAEQLAHDIKTKNPRQLVAFLVGSPLFVATTPIAKPASRPKATAPATVSVPKASTPADPASDFGQQIRDAEAKQAAEQAGS